MNGKNESGERRKGGKREKEKGREREEIKKGKKRQRRRSGAIKGTNGKLRVPRRVVKREREKGKKKRSEIMV